LCGKDRSIVYLKIVQPLSTDKDWNKVCLSHLNYEKERLAYLLSRGKRQAEGTARGGYGLFEFAQLKTLFGLPVYLEFERGSSGFKENITTHVIVDLSAKIKEKGLSPRMQGIEFFNAVVEQAV